MIKKRGQIGIEVVIYTLIGLAIMAVVLAAVNPKIKEYSDRTIITQTEDSLMYLNGIIRDVQISEYNQRAVSLKIKRGEISIIPEYQKIQFVLKDSNLKYSEPGIEFNNGEIKILTEKSTKGYNVFLTLDYKNFINITANNKTDILILTSSPSLYNLLVEYRGGQDRRLDIRQA